MKIALIGYGKMGKEIEKIALSRGHEIVINGKLTFVQFYDSCPFRGDECYIILDFVEDSFVVHVDVFERRIEQVAQ